MSDQRLRRLERTAAQGDTADRARWLAEQVRRGGLAPERLRLAAALGDDAARVAADLPPGPPGPIDAWALGLQPWGGAWVVRAVLQGARLTLPDLLRWLPNDARPQEALLAAEACLAEPSLERALVAAQAGANALAARQAATYTLVGLWLERVLPQREVTALEYVAYACADAAEGAYRVVGRDELPEVSGLVRLERARIDAGIDRPGAFRRGFAEPLIELALTPSGPPVAQA